MKPPRIGSKFTVPRPQKPFQITVTNVTAKSVIGRDARGRKWRVPLRYLAPRPKTRAPARPRRGRRAVAAFKIDYVSYFVRKVPGGYQGFFLGEDDGGPTERVETGVEKSIAAVKSAIVKRRAAEKKTIEKAIRASRRLPLEKRWGSLESESSDSSIVDSWWARR